MPESSAQPAAAAVDTGSLRTALGQYATGVCIVSAPGSTQDEPPFAITVNSFTSVSLEPPLVLWCAQKSSTTYGMWMAADRFGISVLNDSQGDLCERYAIRGNHWMDQPGDYRLGRCEIPVVPGALATFECETTSLHDAGDHTIIVAAVRHFEVDAGREPLLYHRGMILESS